MPTGQNGSGTAASRVEVYDLYGYNTWSKDERGAITRRKFDPITGAITQRIDDVDTSLVSDAPAGWSTVSGFGLHLITDFRSDDQGRITRELSPEHSVDIGGTATTVRTATWTVYQDAAHEVWIGRGYVTGTAPNYTSTLVNPVEISRDRIGFPWNKYTYALSSPLRYVDPFGLEVKFYPGTSQQDKRAFYQALLHAANKALDILADPCATQTQMDDANLVLEMIERMMVHGSTARRSGDRSHKDVGVTDITRDEEFGPHVGKSRERIHIPFKQPNWLTRRQQGSKELGFDKLPADDTRAIIIFHEFGHVLGLNDPANVTAIENPVRRTLGGHVPQRHAYDGGPIPQSGNVPAARRLRSRLDKKAFEDLKNKYPNPTYPDRSQLPDLNFESLLDKLRKKCKEFER